MVNFTEDVIHAIVRVLGPETHLPRNITELQHACDTFLVDNEDTMPGCAGAADGTLVKCGARSALRCDTRDVI